MTTALGVTRPLHPVTIIIDVDSVSSEMCSTEVMVVEELLASSHSPYNYIVVPVRKRRLSSTIAELRKKRCLNAVTNLVTAVVKEENDLDAMEAAELSHLVSEAVAAQETFLRAMWMVRGVYTKTFCNLRETHELQDGGKLGESMKLVLSDTPYNVCCR